MDIDNLSLHLSQLSSGTYGGEECKMRYEEEK